MIDAQYDLSQVKIYDDEKASILRFRDLIPVEDPNNILQVGAGNTPTIKARDTEKLVGFENLFIKNETTGPTSTTKDRPAEVVLSMFMEKGIRHFCSAATGNSTTAFAHACIEHSQFEHSCFIGDTWKHRLSFPKHERIHVHIMEGATVSESGLYKREWEKQHDILPEGGFFNIARRDGLKLAFLEAVDDTGGHFDWYFQGVSTGMGVYAVYRAAEQYRALGRLDTLPRLCCVQEDTCSPHIKAFEAGAEQMYDEHKFWEPYGIADALQKGDPGDNYPYLRNIVIESNGTFVAVSADDIRESQRILLECEGIHACAAGAISLAGATKLLRTGKLDPKARVLVNVTGRERDPAKACPSYELAQRGEDGAWRTVRTVG